MEEKKLKDERFLDLAETGKRRYLAAEFIKIIGQDKRYRNMGNNIAGYILDVINYAFRYGEVTYTQKKDLLSFHKDITIDNIVFNLKYEVLIDKFERGYL